MVLCYPVIKKRVDDPESACYVKPPTIKYLKKYLDAVEDFCKVFDYDKEMFVINVPPSAIRPLLSYQKDSEVYINTFRKIAATLKSKNSVTNKAVLAYMGVVPQTSPVKTAFIIHPATPKISPKNSKESEISSINRNLVLNIETPYLLILREIMDVEGCDSEYSALMFALRTWRKRAKKGD